MLILHHFLLFPAFCTNGAEITKNKVQYHSNFCYFRANCAEIAKHGVEITSPNISL
jgi:hypothetical protein